MDGKSRASSMCGPVGRIGATPGVGEEVRKLQPRVATGMSGYSSEGSIATGRKAETRTDLSAPLVRADARSLAIQEHRGQTHELASPRLRGTPIEDAAVTADRTVASGREWQAVRRVGNERPSVLPNLQARRDRWPQSESLPARHGN